MATPTANLLVRRSVSASLATHAMSLFPQEPLLRRFFLDPKATLDQLCQTQAEPTPTLIAWSRSPLLGGSLGFPSLDCARLVWGDERTAALGVTAIVLEAYAPDCELSTYARRKLAQHQLATGWACELLARRCNLNLAESFLAGTLHDLGLLVFERLARARFLNCLEEIDPLTSTVSVESLHFGCDHASVGAEMLLAWGAPASICEAVRWHHQPQQAEKSERRLCAILALANYLSSKLGYSSLGIVNLPTPSQEILELTGLQYRDLSAVVHSLAATFPQVSQLL